MGYGVFMDSELSLLYATQNLEPLVQYLKNDELTLLPESGWLLKSPPSDDYVSQLFNQYNLDAHRVRNAEIKAGYNTRAKRDLRMFLSEFTHTNLGTNLTRLIGRFQEHNLQSWDYRPKLFAAVVSSAKYFTQLLESERKQLLHREQLGYEKPQKDGLRLPVEEFLNLVRHQLINTYKTFDSGSRSVGNLDKENFQNFPEFFQELLPQWLVNELTTRLQTPNEFHLLNAFAVKLDDSKQVLITHHHKADYYANTQLESY